MRKYAVNSTRKQKYTPEQKAAGLSVYAQQPQNLYRGCTNCHVAVHGSNSPSGKFWHR